MSYVSLTLKYRPATFDEVIGQEHVTRTLRNAVAAGRIHHAYLFAGPRGTGKTSVARVLARALNCEQGPTPDPCGSCAICLSIAQGRALDIVEIDAASNRGIDEIRELREKVKFSPAVARYKLYILDEVHMLTSEAFNALLKTIEEPPSHAFFVLATTEAHRVPATIASRCQRFEFRRLAVSEITTALARIAEKEQIAADLDALAAIARAADGGMRDAQSLLDQMRAYAAGKIDLETVNRVLGLTELQTLQGIVAAVLAGDARSVCEIVDRLVAAGKDLGQLLDDLMLYARDLSRIALGAEPIGPAASAEDPTTIRGQAEALGSERAMGLMSHLAQVRQAFRQSTQHGLLVETGLLEAARASLQLPTPSPPRAVVQSPPPRVATGSHGLAGPEVSITPTPASPELTAPPADEPLRIEIVRQHWPRVESVLRRMHRYPVWALAQHGTPTAVEGDVITISFGAEWKVIHEKLLGENKSTLEQALASVLGRPVHAELVLLDGPLQGSASTEAANGVQDKLPTPLEQVQRTFPGSVVMRPGKPGPVS